MQKEKEAIPIATNDKRQPQAKAPGQPHASKRRGSKKKRTPGSVAKSIFLNLGKFIVIMCCVGVMIGSVAAVLLSQYVVNATANDADLLNLDQIKLSYTTRFLAQDHDTGEWVEYTRLYSDQQRTWVDWGEIPEDLVNAFIATEDQSFWTHMGFNPTRTAAAAVNMVVSKITGGTFGLFDTMQGASTIDQQLIKNITGDDETDPLRKIREVFRAIGLRNRYSPEQIMEAYLNTISLTGQLAGVEAGANQYFNKHVSDLNLAECASIAAITKNPTKYNPATNPEEHILRRNTVLRFMYEQGMITEEEKNEWQAYPLVLAEEQEQETVTHTSNNSWFTDAALDQIIPLVQEKEGFETSAEAYNFLNTQGFVVRLTVDPFMQQEMEKVMLNSDGTFYPRPIQVEDADGVFQDGETPVLDENGNQVYSSNNLPLKTITTNGAMITLDHSNGQVKAVVGGLGEKKADRISNRALQPHQSGSTMKPIGAYSLGIEYRVTHYSDMWQDEPLKQIPDEEHPGQMKDWPQNYGRAKYGQMQVYMALGRSLNTIPVQIANLVGIDNIFTFMHDTLNMSSLVTSAEDASHNDEDFSPLVLGNLTNGVTPLEMAGAYQMFGNGGVYHTPTFFTTIEYPNGEIYMQAESTDVQALTTETATVMNRLLRNPVATSFGTAAGSGISSIGGMEIIGKTGTTQDWKDYMFMGVSPYYVTAVWYGYDEPHSMGGNLNAQNSKVPQIAYKNYATAVLTGKEHKDFPYDSDVVSQRFCTETGDLAGPNCPGTEVGYYLADNVPALCSAHN